MKSSPVLTGTQAFRPPFARRPWDNASLELGELRIDFSRRQVECSVRPSGETAVIELSEREFRLLAYFSDHRGEVVTREQLLIAVWGYRSIPLTRTVDMHIAKLRKKIEPNPREPRFLQTVHGRGYRLTPAPP